jgi:hypothetical protein
MKHLSKLLPLLLFVFSATPARSENLSQCFNIHEMVKSTEARYYVDAVSHCAHDYETVYVMVSFLDANGKHMDNGVWAIYGLRPGRPEIHEFAVPRAAQGFASVVLRKITTDVVEAIVAPQKALVVAEVNTPSPAVVAPK